MDSLGNIYVAGYTKGGLDNNTNSGSTDIILVKYNSSGVKQWTRQLGTSSQDRGEDGGTQRVTVDSSDNIYVTGFSENSFAQNSGWQDDFLLMKFNTDGIKL